MVFYFTGTGNSRYTAEMITKEIGDETIYINQYIKSGEQGEFHSMTPIVFVVPTYGWRMPKVVEEFIIKSKFSGNTKAYFVLTCGDSSGDSGKYARKLCREKKFIYMGLATVVLPENYIAMFDVPSKEEAVKIIEKATPQIREIGCNIGKSGYLPIEKNTFLGKIESSIVNPIFYKTVVSAKGFRVGEGCIGCGKCVTLCPLNNIQLVDNKPKWGNECTHCMACICRCPVECIEYKKKSIGKNRFYNEQ